MSIRTNVFGALAIAVASSFATVAFGNWMKPQPSRSIATQPAFSPTATTPNILECDRGTYSPVQRRCVDQAVFDGEMKRLFEALGLNANAYQQRRQAHDN